MAVIALAIFIEDGGPALFTQERSGMGGRRFTVYKFRSMKARQPQAVVQAVKGDARITRVGAVLRVLSWDELPQLINIVKGDMALVGPRPHAVDHDHAWSEVVPNYAARFRVRPGLTGLAQVRGFRGEISHLDELVARIDADNFYIDNWSLLLDIRIIFLTVPLLFKDPHAY